MSKSGEFVLLAIWGHFESLFEHETAIEIQKINFVLSPFAVECFHYSNKRNFSNSQQN